MFNFLRHILGPSLTFVCLDGFDVLWHNWPSLFFFKILYQISTRSIFSDIFWPFPLFLNCFLLVIKIQFSPTYWGPSLTFFSFFVPARQPWRKKWFFSSMNSIDVWNLASVIWMMYVHVDCRGDACSWFELEIKSTHVDIAKEAENYFYTLPLTLRSFILGCLIYIWSKGKCAFNTNWGSWVEAEEHFDWSLVLAPPLTFQWNHDHSN